MPKLHTRDNAAMRSHLLTPLWVVLLLCTPPSEIELSAAPPQSSPATDLHVFLTAFGKGDSPAVLQGSELTVLVDQTPAQVKAVHAAKDDPLIFAVLVDVSRSDAGSAKAVREAAVEVFQRFVSLQKQGYLVLFNHSVVSSRVPLSVSQAKEALDTSQFGGGTAVFDAIEQTCKQKLSRSRNPERARRVILLISDGADNQSRVTRTRAEEAAMEEGVSVFSIITKSSLSGARGEIFLKEVSQRTGGFSTDKDLKKAVPISLAAIDAQWMISLARMQPSDSKLHPIQIRCTQKGIHIYAPSAMLLE